MAFEKIGIGGVLTFDDRLAVRAMGRASQAFKGLREKTKDLRHGMGQMASGLKTAAVASLPVAYTMFKGMKSAANFEQAVADLGAVSRASEKDMDKLTKKAKEMGIITAFSGTESAQAMELLARSGATTEEQIGAIKGVLDLAAAGNVHYAEAADIASSITRGMNRDFSQTSNLADILTLASTRSNVTVSSLGESFKYGMAQAKAMGIETTELTALFGKLGDASHRGSMAGTALSAMLRKLVKPSAEARKKMQAWGISLTDAGGKMLPVSTIIDKFSKRISAITNEQERSRITTEIFGRQGIRAYDALATAGKKSIDILIKELKNASDGTGVAAEVAERRLDTVKGAFKMLGASVEGMSISVYGPVLDDVKNFVQEATGGLNSVLGVMDILQSAQKEGADMQKVATVLAAEHGEVAVQTALGLIDVVEFLRGAWQSVVKAIKNVGAWLKKTIGAEGIRLLVSMAGKVAAVAAVIGPVILALGGIAFVIKRAVIPAVFGLGTTIKAAMGPWGLILSFVVMLLIKIIGTFSDVEEGSKGATKGWKIFGEDASRIIGGVGAALKAIVNVISKAVDGLLLLGEMLGIIDIPKAQKYRMVTGKELIGLTEVAKKIKAEQEAKLAGKKLSELPTEAKSKEKLSFAKILTDAEAKLKYESDKKLAKAIAEKMAELEKKKKAANYNINNKLCIDGRDVSHSVHRQQVEVQERAGFRTTPWQRRIAMEHGAMPATVSAGR